MMKKLAFTLLLSISAFNLFGQCTNFVDVNFDSFEYTTVCPFIIPGTTYQSTPLPSPANGPSHSGSRHIYLNFVNGYTGPAFDRPYEVCIGDTYRLSFYHRDAWAGQNNTTFNVYDANDVLLQTQTVNWTGSTWNHWVSQEFTATTTELRLEIVNNLWNGTNNDMVVDDMLLEACQLVENASLLTCNALQTTNLFELFSVDMPLGGIWSGPSPLANGDQGTFDPDVCENGEYTYTVNSGGQCYPPTGTVMVVGGASIDLGPDREICQGASTQLDAGPGFDYYDWSTNATSQTITVGAAGTYTVSGLRTGNNLIVNGDFEEGNTGFTSDYVVGTGGTYGQLSSPGTFAISTSPSLVHTNFPSCQDHTEAPGTQMMIINGSANPNSNVWCQTVPVDPNTDYQFSTWVSNALNDPYVAQLQFSINGSIIGNIFSPSTSGCNWSQFYDTWNSDMDVSAEICIVNQNILDAGNDFMIDDISFAPICYETDTIVVTVIPTPVITATPNETICAGEFSNIVASSTTPDLVYTWNPGGIVSETLNVSPATTGFYTVTAVSPEGCLSNLVSRLITVIPAPTVTLTSPASTVCFEGNVEITATSSNPDVTYSWTPNLSATTMLTDNPSTTTEYSVIVESANGCQGFDTLTIDVIPVLEVNISGNLELCEGETTQLTATGNHPAMTFEWSDLTQGNQLNVSPASTTNYGVSGNYFGCPTATDEVTVTVNPIPQVFAPGDFVVCPNEPVSAVATSDIETATIYWTPLDVTGNAQIITLPASQYIYVYATNNGCVSPMDSFLIDVSAACFVEVPNVFTPNGDGTNDFFSLISYDGIYQLDCVILNRWGNVLRQYDTPNFAWDGKDAGGNDVQDGVYFYTITGETNGLEKIEKHGFVQLVRD